MVRITVEDLRASYREFKARRIYKKIKRINSELKKMTETKRARLEREYEEANK